jgi:hypothetical protein
MDAARLPVLDMDAARLPVLDASSSSSLEYVRTSRGVRGVRGMLRGVSGMLRGVAAPLDCFFVGDAVFRDDGARFWSFCWHVSFIRTAFFSCRQQPRQQQHRTGSRKLESKQAKINS